MNEALKPDEVHGMAQPEAAFNRGLFGIVLFSTALALGGMAAAIQALHRSAAGFRFQISLGTLAAFAAGTAAGLLYWKLAARSLLAVRLATAFLVLAGVGAFLYPLRFVPADKLADIAIGLAAATCAVSIIAFLLWRVKRFLDADDESAPSNKVL
jgi:hypothetical protein